MVLSFMFLFRGLGSLLGIQNKVIGFFSLIGTVSVIDKETNYESKKRDNIKNKIEKKSFDFKDNILPNIL